MVEKTNERIVEYLKSPYFNNSLKIDWNFISWTNYLHTLVGHFMFKEEVIIIKPAALKLTILHYLIFLRIDWKSNYCYRSLKSMFYVHEISTSKITCKWEYIFEILKYTLNPGAQSKIGISSDPPFSNDAWSLGCGKCRSSVVPLLEHR